MESARLEVAQRTDSGRDPNKQVNEDAAGQQATPLGHVLVVCDGMGGHALGQEASQLALRTIIQTIESAPPGTPPGAALARALTQAGRVVYQMGGTGPQAGRPGSTCVAVLIHGACAEIAHVGDSRAYLVRQGQIWQLTKDHSVVQQMVDVGAIAPEQAVMHPEANKITRALGMKLETDVELREPALPCTADDIFVLATDGLCDLVRNEEIAAVIARTGKLELASEELVRMANDRGGHDNITVQIARVLPQPGTRPTLPDPITATIVDPRPAPLPEKTLVDPTTVRPPPYSGPTTPLAASPVAGHPATHPGGAPSRRGWMVLVLGFVWVAVILGGVLLWWALRGPR